MAVDVIEVQKMYVAYFGRPGDPVGEDFWTDALDNNAIALDDLSAVFAASQEYRDMYDGMDNRAIVDEIYQNLFGRAAETGGLEHWAGLLDNGTISIDDVVMYIADAASGNDSVAFNGKVAAATLFTDRLDTPIEMQAYAGEAANDIAMEYLATITDLSSAADALDPDTVDAYIERIVNTHGVTPDPVGLVGVAPEPLPVA